MTERLSVVLAGRSPWPGSTGSMSGCRSAEPTPNPAAPSYDVGAEKTKQQPSRLSGLSHTVSRAKDHFNHLARPMEATVVAPREEGCERFESSASLGAPTVAHRGSPRCTNPHSGRSGGSRGWQVDRHDSTGHPSDPGLPSACSEQLALVMRVVELQCCERGDDP